MHAIVKGERWQRCLVDGDAGSAPGAQETSTAPWRLHVRAVGQTWRLAGESLDLDRAAPDAVLLAQVARALQLPPGSLVGYAVDRAPDVVVVRPWAIWG